MKRSPIRWRRACVGLAAAGMLVVPASTGVSSAQTLSPERTVSAPPSATDPAFPDLDGATAAQLDSAVKKVMTEAGVPGVTVGLWASGKGSYVRSFGVADKDTKAPMDPDLYMRIGSETKTFTVTAMLELVDQGKIGLDDTIGRYIDGVPNGDRITLRELAGMRSGLFNYSMDEDFFKALTSDPDRPFTPQELLDYSFKHPVQFQPGEEFEYSNTNLILVGLVVEKVSGTPINEFIQRNVLDPAGCGTPPSPRTPRSPARTPRATPTRPPTGRSRTPPTGTPRGAGPPVR